MMHLVRLPRLGQTMESGIITLWCVEEGASFVEGDPLYEVETEKMNTEVEAKQDGILARIVAPAGAEVPVGALLAVVVDEGVEIDSAAIDALIASASGVVESVESDENLAPLPPTSAAKPTPTSDSAPAPDTAPAAARRPLAVPAARELAKREGIDLTVVTGSGASGVIRVADVERRVPLAVQPEAQPPHDDGYAGPPRVAERITVRGIRRSMADAMTRSWQEIPQFVQQVSLDASALVSRLKRLRYEGMAVTYTDLFVSAVAASAVEVPNINATFNGDEILRYADVNVSIAVATERGLLVPVVRRADALAIDAIAAATRGLSERAREGKLSATDTSGGTITVSNLGAFGIDTGIPIINAPQSALVFVGSMTDQPVVVNGAIAVQKRLNVAIAYDHRVVDGMAAAQFTSALKTRLEAGG